MIVDDNQTNENDELIGMSPDEEDVSSDGESISLLGIANSENDILGEPGFTPSVDITVDKWYKYELDSEPKYIAGDKLTITVTLRGYYGYISDEVVVINVNGEPNNVTTSAIGEAVLVLDNISCGNYIINASYAGNDDYVPANSTNIEFNVNMTHTVLKIK